MYDLRVGPQCQILLEERFTVLSDLPGEVNFTLLFLFFKSYQFCSMNDCMFVSLSLFLFLCSPFQTVLFGNAALFCYFHFSQLASFLYSHILLYSYELLYSNYLLTKNLTIFILNKNKITMKCMNVRQTYQDGKPQVDPCYSYLYSSWGRGRFLLPGLTIMK